MYLYRRIYMFRKQRGFVYDLLLEYEAIVYDVSIESTEDKFMIYLSNHMEDEENLQDPKKRECRFKVLKRSECIFRGINGSQFLQLS